MNSVMSRYVYGVMIALAILLSLLMAIGFGYTFARRVEARMEKYRGIQSKVAL